MPPRTRTRTTKENIMKRLIILGALTLLLALAAPAQAAYNHLVTCQQTLRGLYYSDDDIHALGVRTGATSRY